MLIGQSSAVGRLASSPIRSQLLLWTRLRAFLRRRRNGGYLVRRRNWLRNLCIQSRHVSNRTDRTRLSEMVLRLDDAAQQHPINAIRTLGRLSADLIR